MRYALATTIAMLAASSTLAEQVFNENVIVSGSLCAGADCAAAEGFGVEELKLKDNFTDLLFEDTSTTPGYASTDWLLTANDSGYLGQSHFSVRDMDTDWRPLRIEGGARDNALVVDNLGYIGVGTALPSQHIHIVDGYRPTIRFEQDGSLGETPAVWDILTYHNGFIVKDFTKGVNPFVVEADSHDYALYVDNDRKIGFNTGSPEASLHIHGYLGQARILVREVNASITPRTLMTLQNNGRPEIVLANTSTGSEWSFGAGTNFILKQGTVGSASSAKTKLFEIGRTGDAVLAGSLTTGGPSCGAGCDAVFSPDYDLPSIEAHAAQMFALGHLPNIGPTAPDDPVNLTDHMGRMLNELEHAHIYIARLHRENAGLRAEMALKDAALEARIKVLERAAK